MSLINELRKYAAIRLLEYFLCHPTQEIHLKELSRKSKVSPMTAKTYCDLLEKEEIVLSEKKGNLRIFRLNNENFAVREMKRAYYLLLLKELGIERVCTEGTLAIYGSIASGDFDERSDIDLLIIGSREWINYEILFEIEKKTGKEVQLTVIPPHKWEEMKERRDPFAMSVLRKHCLIRGPPL